MSDAISDRELAHMLERIQAFWREGWQPSESEPIIPEVGGMVEEPDTTPIHTTIKGKGRAGRALED